MIECQPDTAEVHLGIKSLLRLCLDQIGLWGCLRGTVIIVNWYRMAQLFCLTALFSYYVILLYIRKLT